MDRPERAGPPPSRQFASVAKGLFAPQARRRTGLGHERRGGNLAPRRGPARLVSTGVRRLRRGSRLGAAFVRRIGTRGADPACGCRRAWPAARRAARGRRRRRRSRGGGLGRHRAGASLHFARNRDAAHRRDRPIHERAGEARARFRPRAAKPLVRNGGDAQRRRRARFRRAASRRVPRTRSSARRRRIIPAPARFSSCPISAASGRLSTILMRAAFCSA